MRIFLIALLIIFPFVARAADTECQPGWWLNGDACQRCSELEGYYCPGGTIPRQPCPADTVDWLGRTGCTTLLRQMRTAYGVGYSNIPYRVDDCSVMIEMDCPQGVQYRENFWNGTDYFSTSLWWRSVKPGYYLAGATNYDGKLHRLALECTNPRPEHSYWAAAPTLAEDNCPWQCDAGYGRYIDECRTLCAAGVTQLKTATGPAFNIYRERFTPHALVVGVPQADLCYVPLDIGAASNAINIMVGDVPYHTVY